MRLPDSRVEKFILAAILTGMALALSLIDSAISSLIPILPGFKIGLANIVSIFALYYLGLSYSLMICVARSLLAGIFSGNLTMILFSLAGGIASIIVMFLLMRRISQIKVSVTGGIVHNMMQVAVAVLVTSTPQVVYYLPVLIAAGAVSGFFMGLLCRLVFVRLKLETVS